MRKRSAHIYLATDTAPRDVETCETELIQDAFRQLRAYLSGDSRDFALPLAPDGTEFMCAAWNALREIPYGQTASFKYVATALGNPGAGRAVGMANNRNLILISIPFHRVIGSDGRLTGYRGGLALKRRLLELEKQGTPSGGALAVREADESGKKEKDSRR